MSTQKPPVEVVDLFPMLDAELISLLRSLSKEEWLKPTIAGQWLVKDIAAHLLDTNLRTLSTADAYFGDPPGQIGSYQDLVTYLNRLNADWVKAMKRVSPNQLTNLLESTGRQYCQLMKELPLFERAPFAVAWAGEEVSANWFHMAREYTEKWHHQMQIRDAVGRPGRLMDRELFFPCIDTFMYGLPHSLRDIKPIGNKTVKVTVTGDAGGEWFVVFKDDDWKLEKQSDGEIAARVELLPDTAWKLFTKGISPQKARVAATINGDERLCEAVLGMISVMA